MKVATVFSGIGSIESAISQVFGKNDLQIVFACDNGEREIPYTKEEVEALTYGLSNIEKQNLIKKLYLEKGKNNFVKTSYMANYSISEAQWYEDIRFIDGNQFKNEVDLFVGGSPCQSFSSIGKKGGLEDARGTLFYDFARLIKEIEPKVFLYENVPGMLSHDNGKTWEIVQEIFRSLGYKVFIDKLNSKDYGIPQNRNRLYVVGFKNPNTSFKFPKTVDLNKTAFDFLDKEVDVKYYFKEKGFKFVSTNAHRAKVNSEIIRTQKANQQFNWNGNFIFEKFDEIKHSEVLKSGAFLGEFGGEKGFIRKLTPNECFKLMGFNSFKIEVPDVQAYRQAGNSIVVNVLENILKSINEALVYEN